MVGALVVALAIDSHTQHRRASKDDYQRLLHTHGTAV